MHSDPSAAGLTLVEVMIAMVVLAVGILAVARMFPAGARSQTSSRMLVAAGQYTDEQFERLRGLPRTNAQLSVGRHPATGFDSLGTTRAWRRYYVVTAMSAPLDSLLQVQTTVLWRFAKPESLRMTGYLFP